MGVDTIAHRMLFHGVDYREASAYNYSHTPLRHQYGGKQEPYPTTLTSPPQTRRPRKACHGWYSTDVISQDKDDRASKRIRRMTLTDRLIRHPGRLPILYFSVLILLSTGLLMLPISTTNHDGFSNFPVSFFTAVSALSTCGIPVVDTGEYWSMFGQLVILFSIQFGGLGVMTFASIVALGGYSAGVASAGNPACLFILAAAMIVGRGFRNHHRQPVGCRHLRPVGQIGLSEARPHSAAHWRPPYHQCGKPMPASAWVIWWLATIWITSKSTAHTTS